MNTNLAPSTASANERRSLWIPILAGGLIMGLALGVRHVQGLFLLPVTMDRGWSREMFGFTMAVQNLTWGLAQPFTGMIADRYGSAKVIAGGLVFYALGLWGGTLRRKYLLAGLYLARTVAMALFVLLPLSTWGVYLFAAVMGFLWLGTVPLTNGLVSQIFGVRYITTLFGFVFFGHQLGSFFGVWLGGRMFEATGSYLSIWLLAIALGLLATVLHWPIDDRTIVRADPRLATS